MSVLASTLALAAAKLLGLAGIVLFFKPLLSGVGRALLLWFRLRILRHRSVVTGQ